MPETAKNQEREVAQMHRAELIQKAQQLVAAIDPLRHELDETREQIRAMNRLLEAKDA